MRQEWSENRGQIRHIAKAKRKKVTDDDQRPVVFLKANDSPKTVAYILRALMRRVEVPFGGSEPESSGHRYIPACVAGWHRGRFRAK